MGLLGKLKQETRGAESELLLRPRDEDQFGEWKVGNEVDHEQGDGDAMMGIIAVFQQKRTDHHVEEQEQFQQEP